MSKKRILLISIIAILILAVTYFGVRFLKKSECINDIEKFMRDTYEKVDSTLGIDTFKNTEIKFSLYDLEDMGKDIEVYKKNKCDFEKSNIIIEFSEGSYNLEVNLFCKNY